MKSFGYALYGSTIHTIWLQNLGLPELVVLSFAIALIALVLWFIVRLIKKAQIKGHDQQANSAIATFEENSSPGLDLETGIFFDKADTWVLIEGGLYMMGCPEHEYKKYRVETAEVFESLFDLEEKINAPESESTYPEIPHPVRLGDFYIMKYLVTLGEFEQFVMETAYQTDAEKAGSSRCWNGKEWLEKAGINWRQDAEGNRQFDKKHPVVHVSWNDAVAFCNWLSSKSEDIYRLPTEAEWEYACRAGTTTAFYTGENLTTDQANYNGHYPLPGFPKGKYLDRTTPVGLYPPNAYGLYDMHGNVWEWCSDWYSKDYYKTCKSKGEVINPTGPAEGTSLVLRGGSWNSVAELCRSAYRLCAHPGFRLGDAGFRVVREMR